MKKYLIILLVIFSSAVFVGARTEIETETEIATATATATATVCKEKKSKELDGFCWWWSHLCA